MIQTTTIIVYPYNFLTVKALRAVYPAGVPIGHPAYSARLDGNHNGVA